LPVSALRGLEVDDELKLRRLFDGKIGGFGALENLVDERLSTAIVVNGARRILDQSSCLAISLWPNIDGNQARSARSAIRIPLI
jgi:hypothetical protein